MNILDVLTMIPIFLVGISMKHIALTCAIFFIGICGMIHHYHIDNMCLLYLDIIAIGIGISAYTYYSKIDTKVKPFLYIIESLVIAGLFANMVANVKYEHRELLIAISCIWLPNILFSIKWLSNLTIGLTSVFIILYMYSRCVYMDHEYCNFIWPALHICLFATLYLSFRDMDMLRPNVLLKYL